MAHTATATARTSRLRLVQTESRTASADREDALRRVRAARRHVETAPSKGRSDRFAYLKRVYD